MIGSQCFHRFVIVIRCFFIFIFFNGAVHALDIKFGDFDVDQTLKAKLNDNP